MPSDARPRLSSSRIAAALLGIPWLNLGNAAKLLKIAPKTLRLAAKAGEIEAFHPLSDGPWIFARAVRQHHFARERPAQ